MIKYNSNISMSKYKHINIFINLNFLCVIELTILNIIYKTEQKQTSTQE